MKTDSLNELLKEFSAVSLRTFAARLSLIPLSATPAQQEALLTEALSVLERKDPVVPEVG